MAGDKKVKAAASQLDLIWSCEMEDVLIEMWSERPSYTDSTCLVLSRQPSHTGDGFEISRQLSDLVSCYR